MMKRAKLSACLPTSVEKALQSMYEMKTGETLKVLEESLDSSVSPINHFIIRIDGVSFSNYTKGMVKPFDPRLTDAMVKTTVDLVQKFNAVLGYHQSDEISLLFPKIEENAKKSKNVPVHFYKGRVQKLSSVTASYASVRFNYYMNTFVFLQLHHVAMIGAM